jgi:pimeloyl-ACP methyl ester carboxylesterase
MKYVTVGDKQLEYMWLGPPPNEAPTLVFLHEGLGSLAMWRGFPQRLVEQLGFGALVYSRAGYGNSEEIELPRTVRFMHDEALITLPHILDEFAISQAILVGHSDGGSIALINAGGAGDHRVRGLILMAPHVFVEETGLQSIRSIAAAYRHEDQKLKQRLGRYHEQNVDQTFWGWNDVWLDPEFRSWNIEAYLPQIRVPVLVIQGENDEYGTLAQVRAIEQGCQGPVQSVILPDCGHSPHVDQPELTLAAMSRFLGERATRKIERQ